MKNGLVQSDQCGNTATFALQLPVRFEIFKLKTCIWSFVFDSSFDYKVSEGPLASLASLNVWTNHGRARFYGHPIIIRVRLKAKKE